MTTRSYAGMLLCGVLLLTPGAAMRILRAQAPPQGQRAAGMHIYIWSGLESHGAGQHDYPQFLADWSKILTEHGAIVDGALHPPGSAELEHADVVVIYKGDAGYLSGDVAVGGTSSTGVAGG